MHKTRLAIIVMFMLTILGGAAVAGFGTARASTAPAAAHHALNAKTAERRSQTWRWRDLRNCLYKVTIYTVGSNGLEIWINTDTCNHPMWTVARCRDGKNLYGNVVYSHGHWSSTYGRGGCGAGNLDGLHWWGIRDKQFVTHVHLATRLHCLSSSSCT